MANKVQPLHQGGNPSFPLSSDPYYSRVEEQELVADSNDVPKNYTMLAFRPGFSLQASELNEIQEHFQMQLTLSIAMMHNWITSGPGLLWGGWNQQAAGGEGASAVSENYGPEDDDGNSIAGGIGVGGGYDTDGVSTHEPKYAISAPGWKGSCPLHPYESPYQGGSYKAPVEISGSIAGEFTITFNPGWWLMEVKDWWNGSSAQPKDISGLKHWVYLNEEKALTYSVPINLQDENIEIPIGFKINSYYKDCDDDSDLSDNSSNGIGNSASCGASRYQLEIAAPGVVEPNSGNSPWGDPASPDSKFANREKLSLVCKINPARKTLRYMNNLTISKIS